MTPSSGARRHQTTHNNLALPRVQRRASRSSNNRQASRSLSSTRQDSTFSHSQPWHVESNPHCNGGLKNALESVRGRLRRRLWVGTLGTNTDKFKESLRRSMEWKMKEKHESLPVWIPDDEFASCYDEFCHQVSDSDHQVESSSQLTLPGPLALPSLCNPRRPQNQVILRIRLIQTICCSEPAIC